MTKILSLDRFLEEDSAFSRYRQRDGADNSESLLRIKKLLPLILEQELSESQRDAVIRYYYQGEKIPQIARDLGVHKSTISRRIQTAQRRIRRAVQYLL